MSGDVKIARLAIVVASAAVAAVCAATSGRADNPAGPCTPLPSWPSERADLSSGLASLVNAYRQSHGLAPLAVSPALTASATWKARHMAAYGYLSHDDPAPPAARTFDQRIGQCGFGAAAAENVARWYASPTAVLAAWLADAAHRGNIEGQWTLTGIGAAVSAAGIVYWAEDFGQGSVPAANPTPSPDKPICIVPSVHGLRSAAAAARVRRAGCTVAMRRLRSRPTRSGTVAWQAPHGRVRVPRNTRVTLAISA